MPTFSMSASPRKVLIMSVSAGSGHVRAAEALAKAFQQNPAIGEVRNVDALQFTNKLFRDFYSKLYLRMVRSAPQVVGALYKASDEPWKGDNLRLAMDRLNTGKLVKFVSDFSPDLIICTHFMPANIMAHLMENGKLHAHLSIVVTDFDCHAMWLSRVFHRYFVALEETSIHLQALGLPASHITVSGIPTDSVFAEKVDRDQLRQKHGLDLRKPTLLVSAGTFGLGPAEYIVSRLRQLNDDVQILVTCGKGDELRNKVASRVEGDSRFHVLGYCNYMHELMQMADLFIGKPGGLTTAEALVCGLPMVIFSPIPGQEERNSDHLLEEGIAIRGNDLTTIAYKVNQLLANPQRLASMRANALRLAQPEAANLIVNTLLHDRVKAVKLTANDREAMVEAALRP